MTTLVARGIVRPDGWIELLDPVELPPKPYEATVRFEPRESIEGNGEPSPTGREPSGFWLSESIPAPFDLPRYGPARIITPVKATGPYLPDPVFVTIDGEVLE